MSEGACEFLSGFDGGRQNKNWHPGYVLQTDCRKTGGIAMKMQAFRAGGMLTSMAGSLLFAFGALADPLGFAVPVRYPAIIFQQVLPDRGEDDRIESAAEVPAHLRRQVVEDPTREARGTVVIDLYDRVHVGTRVVVLADDRRERSPNLGDGRGQAAAA